MLSSGTNPVATSSAADTDVIPEASVKRGYRHAMVVTAVAGFVTFDGGFSYHRVQANIQNDFWDIGAIQGVKVKRDGATDMNGVFASIW